MVCPDEVHVPDFIDPELWKALLYGIYGLQHNEGFVSIGIDKNTADFASEATWRCWKYMGNFRYEGAKKLLITADIGGSN
jgi:hypothetical protein